MKMSYRDKMILLVFTVILIIVGGIVLLINPLKKDIEVLNNELVTLREERDKVQSKQKEIPVYQELIKKNHTAAKDIADDFSGILQPEDMDQFMMKYLNDCFIEVDPNVAFTPPSTQTLSYYYYAPSVITYPLYTAADINGKFAAENAKTLLKSTTLSQRNAEAVVVTNVGISYRAKKADLLKFIDVVNGIPGTHYISTVSIGDYSFGRDSEVPEDVDYSNGTIEISFYSVQQIDELDTELFS